jgi:hypothetical protein
MMEPFILLIHFKYEIALQVNSNFLSIAAMEQQCCIISKYYAISAVKCVTIPSSARKTFDGMCHIIAVTFSKTVLEKVWMRDIH